MRQADLKIVGRRNERNAASVILNVVQALSSGCDDDRVFVGSGEGL